MKKKLLVAILLAVLVCALCLATACEDSGKLKVTPETLSVVEGKTATVTAQSDSSEDIAWSISDETILKLGIAKGKICSVTALKPGKADIVATQGTQTAKCEVTVTSILDQPRVEISYNNQAVTENDKLSVEHGKTLQLSAKVLNSTEKITAWYTDNPSKATVSADGLVTALLPGKVTVTAQATSSLLASVEVEITLKEGSVYYDMKCGEEKGANSYNPETQKFDSPEELKEDEFFFWHGRGTWGQQEVVLEHAYYLDGTIGVKYTSDWDPGYWFGFQIFYKSSTQTKGSYYALSCKINVNEDCVVTLNDNRVELHAGDNNVTVYYRLTAGLHEDGTSSFDLALGYNDGTATGSFLKDGEVYISDVRWEEITERTTLVAPTFTITDVIIAINDPNQAGVESYTLTFFQGEKAVGSVAVANGEKINDDPIDKGTYTVKIQALPTDIRYIISDYSETALEFVVLTDASYTLQSSGNGGAVQTPGRWTYWTENWVQIDDKLFAEQKLTFTFGNNAGNWYDTQLFYKNPGNREGVIYKLTFELELKDSDGGHITVCGNEVALKTGQNTITVYYQETQDASMQMVLALNGQSGGAQEIQQGTIVISNLVFEEAAVEQLSAPSFELSAENVITITDSNPAANVKAFELGFFQDGDQPVRIVVVENGKAVDLSKIAKGTYTVKLRTTGALPIFATSDWSTATATVVSTTELVEEDFGFGENGPGKLSVTSPDKWYYWNDQNWVGSNVTIASAKIIGDVVTVEYSATGVNDFGLQLFYDYSANVAGKTYQLKITVRSSIDNTIKICGEQIQFKAGEAQELVLEIVEPAVAGYDGATISIQVPVANNGGVVELWDISVTEVK